MKKLILVKIEGTLMIEIDVPEKDIDRLEDCYYIRPYIETNKYNEFVHDPLYKLLIDKIDLDNLDFDKFEILEVNDSE